MNKRSMKLADKFLRFFYAQDGASLIIYFPDNFVSLTIDSPIGYAEDKTFPNVRFEGIIDSSDACALRMVAEYIMEGRESSVTVQCFGAISLTLAGEIGQNGQIEATMTISKCDISTSFKFNNCRRKANGDEPKSDLEVFSETMHEHLTPVCFRK